MYNSVSRFLEEIPDELLEREKKEEKVQKILKSSENNRFKESSPFLKNSIFANNTETINSESNDSPVDYGVGDIVIHKKFGRGMITGVKPIGNDAKLEIAFDTVGTKHLMAVYANLQKE
jgi:DNA helicase-2/ATP-dependent DNA helicase PcrA